MARQYRKPINIKNELFKQFHDTQKNHINNLYHHKSIYEEYSLKTELWLDSAYKLSTSDMSNGKFQFRFDKNYPHCEFPLSNIISIEACSFYLPTLIPADTYQINTDIHNPTYPVLSANGSAPTDAEKTQIPYHKRIVVDLKEINDIYIHDGFNKRHLFEYDVTEINDGFLLTPLEENKKISFAVPGRDISQLTVEIFNPFHRICFLPDVLYNVSATNNGSFLSLTTASAHGLTANERIYVSGLSTTDSRINSWVSSGDGCHVGTSSATTHIELNPDVTVYPLPLGAGPYSNTKEIRVLIPARRIIMPFSIKYHVPFQIYPSSVVKVVKSDV